MKTLTRDKKKDTAKDEPSIKNKLSAFIDIHKRQIANFLGRQSEKLSSKQKKLTLLCLGIMMGMICLTLIVRPFQYPSLDTFNISKGIEAAAIIPPDTSEPIISHEDFRMLFRFRLTLDSLYRVDRTTYDEVLRGHEGLLDSINFLISIYK